MLSSLFAVLPAPAALAQSPEPVLAPVTVTAQGDALAASAEAGAGFRADKAVFGPLGERSVLDTPYAASTLSSDFIDNSLATSLVDLLKYLPSAQMEARGGLDVGRPQTRGLESSVAANNHIDGFNVAGTTAYPMEMFERVEVIASLTGALYGPASPSGNFNFVSKRPTDTPLRRLTLGYGSTGIGKVHADLGGRIGETGAIGYRVNLLHEEGEGYVAHSDLRRDLASLAFDVHFSPDTVLELNASHYEFEKMGYPGGFSYGPARKLPNAPDAAKAGFGIEDAGLDLKTDGGNLLLKHRFNDDWRISAGYSRQIVDRAFTYPTHSLSDDLGNYTTAVSVSTAGRFTINSNQVTLNGKLRTGIVSHDLVVSTTGFTWDVFSARNAAKNYAYGSASLAAPREHEGADWSTGGSRFHASSYWQQSFILGDTMTFNDRWSALVVASYSKLHSRNYNAAGAHTGSYDDEGISPTVAVMYKPRPDMTLYAAYADSLQQGDTAPTSGVLNPGESLPPYRSEQWEAGFKWRAAGLDAGAAVFRVERPFAYTTGNVFKEQGNQVNHGLELTVSGEVIDGLAIYGGVTFLNPRLKDTALASTQDKRVVGVPRVQANLLAEYRVAAVPGLVLSGNVHHTGKRAANDTNTTWADGYTTLDLGARYATRLMGRTTVWRLAVNNVTDERYWASIFPGNINGNNGAANAFLGSPREVRASVSFDL